MVVTFGLWFGKEGEHKLSEERDKLETERHKTKHIAHSVLLGGGGGGGCECVEGRGGGGCGGEGGEGVEGWRGEE